jgi:thiamine biosynthesis lipoprotein
MIGTRHHMGKSRLVRGFSIMAVASLAVSCSTDHKPVMLEGRAQGTTFSIKYIDSLERDLSGEVDSLFRLIDRSMSLWDTASTVSQFNRARDRFETGDAHFRTVLALAERAYLETSTAFDPTVLPLVDAWGMGKEGRAALDTVRATQLRHLVGMDRLSMEEITEPGTNRVERLVLYKAFPEVGLDLNGIAQGYTVDMLAVLLRMHGITNFMIEVGGEVRANGLNERGTPWSIQIDKPVPGEGHAQQTVVPLQDRSLATSGNYRKFFQVGDQRYGHMVDPRAGRPAMNALLSASVIADNCAMADAYGTAFMVMGPEPAKGWLARHPEVDSYLVMDDGKGGYEVWTTPAWPAGTATAEK